MWVPRPRNGAQLISYAPSKGPGAKNKVITPECLSLLNCNEQFCLGAA